MERFRIIGVLIVLLLLLGIGFFVFGSIHNVPFLTKQSTIRINNTTFTVTVANSDAQKITGLSQTSSLQKNQGMYFPFSTPGYYSFWMKNMKFPLDIIFISQGKIVTIVSNAQVPQNSTAIQIYKPTKPADAVLEINAGLSDQDGFKVGDSIQTSL